MSISIGHNQIGVKKLAEVQNELDVGRLHHGSSLNPVELEDDKTDLFMSLRNGIDQNIHHFVFLDKKDGSKVKGILDDIVLHFAQSDPRGGKVNKNPSHEDVEFIVFCRDGNILIEKGRNISKFILDYTIKSGPTFEKYAKARSLSESILERTSSILGSGSTESSNIEDKNLASE